MTVWRLPALSREWVGPITVAVDDVPTTGWTYLLLPWGEKPATPEDINLAPYALDGGLGILVGPGTSHVLLPGEYRVWLRYVDAPEAPVLYEDMVIVIR